MRRFITYINILLCILFNSCNSQPIPSGISPTIGEIKSRDAIGNALIASGSQALINAQGGVSLTNEVFTFDGSSWKNGEETIRIDNPDGTTLTALYPAYSEEKLITRHPYHNDTLRDVLIAQNTFTDETDIQLDFRHLFSRLTVHIHSSIASSVDAVTINVPQVTEINPISGNLTTSGTHTIPFAGNDTGIYSCLVPSLADCPLTLTFTFASGNEVSHPLTHTFISGRQYECHVNRPGIRNADDLIAFAELINNVSYSGDRTLDEFRTINGTDTIYNLLADISLNTAQSNKLNPIGGYNTKRPFTHIFEGNGHTISGLVLKASTGYTGLFGKITSTAIVRNLTLTDCSSPTITNSTQKGSGILVGLNEGIISNCHVSNSYMINENENSNYLGGIAGTCSGKIINCSVTSTTLTSTEGPSGAIAGYLYGGEITNSYSCNNTTDGNSTYRGGISGFAMNGTITNCYVYSNNNTKGQFIGYGNKTSIKYCYYDISKSTLALIKEATNCTTTPNYKYNSNFCYNDTPISNLLNQWIGEQTIYRRWTTADDGSPCFE